MLNELKNQAKKVTKEFNDLIIECEKLNLINEQWFLTFLDEMNDLSVKY